MRRRREPDWLLGWAAAAPGRVALRAASGGWTFGQLAAAVDALSTALARAGVAEGTRVAALLDDDAPAVTLLHALRRLGAVHIPLNRRASDAELENQVRKAGASLVAHDRPHAARASRLGVEVGAEPFAIDGGPASFASSEDVRPRDPRALEPAGLRDEVDLAALAAIVFTSGTTGRPVGVPLRHGHLVASADAWGEVLAPLPTDRWLACLPLFHVAGLAILVRASRWGVPVEVMATFDAGDVAERLRAGISHASLVAAQLGPVLDAWAEGARTAPAGLRAVLLGGGPIPQTLLARARAAGLPVLTTYGMTETASGIAVGGADAATLADPTALRPLPGVELRIAAPDDLGVGGIEVRGPMVARPRVAGGPADPVATDGWLATGDLGWIDADGGLHIVDRREDLIVSGGENISPAEVEAVLRTHPDVREVAVVGRPDPVWGSVPVAAVVLAPGSSVSDASLERHCRARLAGYKVPARFVRFGELPRNAAGKVLRQELRRAISGEPS